MLIIKEDSYSWCIIFIYTFISVLLIRLLIIYFSIILLFM